MRKKIMILGIALILCSICMAEELETEQSGPQLVAYADANASALAVSGTSWAAAKNWVADISSRANQLKVEFYAYDPCGPNDATFNYEYYVADYGCNAQKAAAGAATVGAAQMSHNPVNMAEINSGAVDPNYCWVDTLGAVTTDWKDGDIDLQNNGGLNDIASFIFDRQSGRKHWCRIYDRSSPTLRVWCIAYGY